MKSLLTVLFFFVLGYTYGLNVTINPLSFSCGSITVSGNTGCNHNGALSITPSGNPSGINISGISMITGGNFTFNMSITPDAPAVGTLVFTILTSDDPTGCALPNATQSLTIDITCACNLIVDATIQNESCFGCLDGSIDLDITGNAEPTTYIWSNGSGGPSIMGLTPGAYQVSILDAFGCTYTDTYTVEAYVCTPFTINATVQNAICHDDCNGSIQLSALSNGNTAFAAVWNEGASSTYLGDLCAATYLVTVTDTDNCTATSSYVVTQPNDIFITIDSIRNFNGVDSGAVFFTIGGLEPNDPSCAGCVCLPGYGCICGVCGESLAFTNLPPGDAVLVFTLESGCEVFSPTFTISNISSNKDISISPVKVYPNPTQDVINIGDGNIIHPESEVTILDVVGRVCMRPTSLSDIDVSTLNTGIYFIQVKSSGQILQASFNKL